ncbi:MAG: T9SS type A sorting domain-containing protein [Candidatus Cloacimonetes bacterium]|nr:T9SS type A sorting domain-containing protein [Candidatus Cloacimonadota bacterium]
MRKNLIVIFCVTLLIGSLMATDLVSPGPARNAIITQPGAVASPSRDVPDYSFAVAPTELLTSYYDYMPGSYNSFPIRLQPTDAGDGIYAIFHGQEVAGGTRREFYAYIDNSGSVINVSTIGNEDLHEGYGGVSIDPVCGDALVSWHVNSDTTTPENECVFTYDLYHLMGGPGLWRTPFDVISVNILTPFADDEYEWPYVYIGPSPVAGKRRVYVSANNSVGHDPNGTPSENVLIAYADFDENDLAAQSSLDWSYNQIDLLNNWNQGIPEWIRPFLSMVVSKNSGTVAYVGYNTQNKLIAFVNDNYGEGEWTYYSTESLNTLTNFQVDNPQNLDGSYVFDLQAGEQLFWGPINCHHHSAVFAEGDSKIVWNATMGLQIDNEDGSYYPYYIFPKAFSFDMITHEFSFADLDLTGDFPNDEYPMIPWDLDANGEVDEYDDQGNVVTYSGWPIYFYDNDQAFHDNDYKTAINEEKGWMVAMWQDGLKAKLANAGDPQWVDWADVPEVAIAVSKDYGVTWSEPFFLNSIDTPELSGSIPCYIYCADEIEETTPGHGLLHLLYYDDNSYGTSLYSFGNPTGGTITYAALDIEFEEVGTSNHTVPAVTGALNQNYPNPFNPSTAMSFNLPEPAQASVVVYNNKGQKICTVADGIYPAQTSTVTWNGTDDNGQPVSSGIYYYQLKVNGVSQDVKKCVLMK